jgi:ribosomal protein L37E
MEETSERINKGLMCPRCGRQMYILSHGTQRCASCGFWKRF